MLCTGPVREIRHVLTLWFQGGEGGLSSSTSSSLASLELVKFKLAPACVDISDLVVDNEGSAEGLTRMVSGRVGKQHPEQAAVCPRLGQ